MKKFMDLRNKKIIQAIPYGKEFLPENGYLMQRMTALQSKIIARDMVLRVKRGNVDKKDDTLLEIISDDLMKENIKIN